MTIHNSCDSDDYILSGCGNASQCQQQQFFSKVLRQELTINALKKVGEKPQRCHSPSPLYVRGLNPLKSI